MLFMVAALGSVMFGWFYAVQWGFYVQLTFVGAGVILIIVGLASFVGAFR